MSARLPSQVRAASPRALRSAFSRLKRSWVMRSATVGARLVAGALEDEGAAVVLGGLVVVGAALVVGAAVVRVVAGGLRLTRVVAGCPEAVAPWSPPPTIWPTRAALAWIERSADLGRSAPGPSGRACAGSRNHASTSGSTIRPTMRRFAIQDEVGRACWGAALRPEVRSSRTVPASRSGDRGSTTQQRRVPCQGTRPAGRYRRWPVESSGGMANDGRTLSNQPVQCQAGAGRGEARRGPAVRSAGGAAARPPRRRS